jgi:hypothetical protein
MRFDENPPERKEKTVLMVIQITSRRKTAYTQVKHKSHCL